MNRNWDAAFAACKSYEEAEVSAALQAAIDAAGGLDWVTPGMRVALKLNLVSAMKPEQAATVHPAVVCALVKLLTARGAHVILGDSPGGLYTAAHLQRVYDVTGLRAAEALGAELNADFSVCPVSYPEAAQARSFTMTAYLKQADAIIDVCKLKTHGFTGYSCAVKNLYGLIPGLVKAEVHSKYPELDDFCDNLIDIERFASEKILLHVVDGVIGMEGEGPTNGTPRFVGKIIACDDAYITDVAAVKLFDEPSKMPLLLKAVERGLLNSDFGASCVDYSECEKAYIEDFKRVSVLHALFNKRGFLRRFLRKEWVTRKPVIKKSVCRGCEKCFRHCPRQAIEMKSDKSTQKKRAFIHSKQCIRCYCCQELCPFAAISVKKNFIIGIISSIK
mgnify:CR=1 FL=1